MLIRGVCLLAAQHTIWQIIEPHRGLAPWAATYPVHLRSFVQPSLACCLYSEGMPSLSHASLHNETR